MWICFSAGESVLSSSLKALKLGDVLIQGAPSNKENARKVSKERREN